MSTSVIQIENPEDKENINILNCPAVKNKLPQKDYQDQKAKKNQGEKLRNQNPLKNKDSLPQISDLVLTSKEKNLNNPKSNVVKPLIVKKNCESAEKKLRYQKVLESYRTRENSKCLVEYGVPIFEFNRELDIMWLIPENFLLRHKISPVIRTKMVDWMVEVLAIYKMTDESFFQSVNIMDNYIFKTKNVLQNANIHLIGMTSMLIATKFEEIYPISMSDFVEKIGHRQFTSQTIKKCEKKLLHTISFESLVIGTVYDFIRTFFVDLKANNKETLKEKNAIYCDNIQETAIYLGKILLHYEHFYSVCNNIKSVCCICTAKKIVSDYYKEKFTSEIEDFYNEWLYFLIEQNSYKATEIENVSNEIYSAYLNYQKWNYKNLNVHWGLSFMKEKK